MKSIWPNFTDESTLLFKLISKPWNYSQLIIQLTSLRWCRVDAALLIKKQDYNIFIEIILICPRIIHYITHYNAPNVWRIQHYTHF